MPTPASGATCSNFVVTREQQIINVVDTDTIGMRRSARWSMARWGFAATRDLTTDGVASGGARSGRHRQGQPRRPRPARSTLAAAHRRCLTRPGRTPSRSTRSTIPVEEKADLLIKRQRRGDEGRQREVRRQRALLREGRDATTPTPTARSSRRRSVRSWAPMQQSPPSRADFSDFQNRGNTVQPMGRGWEYVLAAEHRAERHASGAKKRPRSSRPSRSSRALRPRAASRRTCGSRSTSRSPTPPNSIARWATKPTTPAPASSRRRRRCSASSSTARDCMNIQGDRSQPGALRHRRLGRRRGEAGDFLIIKNGMLNDYQTTREQAPLARLVVRASRASRRARTAARTPTTGQRAVPAHAERVAAAGRRRSSRSRT